MRMRNYLKEKLAEKPYVLGAFVASCNPTNVEILGMNGLDFVILDMEHSPLGLETMVDMIRAAEAYGMVAIPRVYTIETKLMRRVLDVGAHGLLVPMVNNMDDARYIMDAVKFPPLGARGMNAGRGPRWGGATTTTFRRPTTRSSPCSSARPGRASATWRRWPPWTAWIPSSSARGTCPWTWDIPRT